MYREYYNLRLKPFQINTDHRFLWLGEKHKEALAVLQYGILDNKGFLLLTGDVGTGKTTLLNALIDSLGEDVHIALINDPGLAKMDFFKFVAASFKLDRNFKSKGDFLLNLQSYLLDIHRQNKQTLLIIDECQHLNQKLLEEVRLLSNIEKYDTKLINIFFVGQSEFNDIILRPRNRAIRQRITINYNITALTEKDTEQYIRHRLKVAGADRPIFTARGFKEVYKFSNGYPRLINIICDQALVTGFVKEKKKIDHSVVAECAAELKISRQVPTRYSLATPEAADAMNAETPSLDVALVPADNQPTRQINKPLVFAFIVVVAIWLGVVALFFLNRQQSSSAHQATGKIQQSEIPAPSAKQPVQATESIPIIDPKEVSPVESNVPQESQERLQSSIANASDQTNAIDTLPTIPEIPDEIAVEDTEDQPLPSTVESAETTAAAEPSITLMDIQNAFGVYPEIPFGFNSNTFDSESQDKLALIARYCLDNPDAALVLWGYTDQSGAQSYNIKLAEFRSDVVKYYLMGQGVSADAITTRAIGPGTEGPGGISIPFGGLRRKVVIEIIPPPGA